MNSSSGIPFVYVAPFFQVIYYDLNLQKFSSKQQTYTKYVPYPDGEKV